MTPTNGNKMGEMLRLARGEMGFSVRALGKLVGVSESNITRYELGEHSPSIDNLRRLAQVLELDFNDLLTAGGYVAPEALPALPIYLRAKLDMTDEQVAQLEQMVEELRAQKPKRQKGGRS